MKGKVPMTLAEMASRSASQVGRLECPKCGCHDFRTYGHQKSHIQTVRYKECRHCQHRFLTAQQPEVVIRDVERHDDDSKIV